MAVEINLTPRKQPACFAATLPSLARAYTYAAFALLSAGLLEHISDRDPIRPGRSFDVFVRIMTVGFTLLAAFHLLQALGPLFAQATHALVAWFHRRKGVCLHIKEARFEIRVQAATEISLRLEDIDRCVWRRGYDDLIARGTGLGIRLARLDDLNLPEPTRHRLRKTAARTGFHVWISSFRIGDAEQVEAFLEQLRRSPLLVTDEVLAVPAPEYGLNRLEWGLLAIATASYLYLIAETLVLGN